jgi:hypothetical protein
MCSHHLVERLHAGVGLREGSSREPSRSYP